MARYLDATNDVAFRKIFRNEERLKAFLNTTLRLKEGKRIQEIKLLSPHEIPDIGQGKESIFDLKCMDESGNIFVVEMQNCRDTHFLKRAQYYASKAYSSKLRRGDTYESEEEETPFEEAERIKKLMPIIVVAVSSKSLFPDHIDCISFHRTLEEKTKEQHLFALSYVFIELSKFKKSAKSIETLEDGWLHFLKYAKKDVEPPNSIKDKYLLDAYKALERFNWTPEEFDAYDRARIRREQYEDNFEDGIEIGIKKGREEGIAIGEKRGEEKGIGLGVKAVAQSMLQKNMDISLIMELTGLTEDAIKALGKT